MLTEEFNDAVCKRNRENDDIDELEKPQKALRLEPIVYNINNFMNQNELITVQLVSYNLIFVKVFQCFLYMKLLHRQMNLRKNKFFLKIHQKLKAL